MVHETLCFGAFCSNVCVVCYAQRPCRSISAFHTRCRRGAVPEHTPGSVPEKYVPNSCPSTNIHFRAHWTTQKNSHLRPKLKHTDPECPKPAEIQQQTRGEPCCGHGRIWHALGTLRTCSQRRRQLVIDFAALHPCTCIPKAVHSEKHCMTCNHADPATLSPAIRCENASGAAMFHASGKRPPKEGLLLWQTAAEGGANGRRRRGCCCGKRPPKEGHTAAEGGAAAVVRAARSMHEARMKYGRAGSVSWFRCLLFECVCGVLCTATPNPTACWPQS
jgi:hypothetical protein